MSTLTKEETQAIYEGVWVDMKENRDGEIAVAKMMIAGMSGGRFMRGSLEFTICGKPTMIHFDLTKGRFWTVFEFTGEEVEI